MEYMFKDGFLGTRAPLFMDITTLIVALLPFLVAFAILFAKKRKYKIHAFLQTVILSISLVIIGYFEYGIRLGGGFNEYIKNSSVNSTLALSILILHILIATITLYIWIATVIKANIKKPQTYNHKKLGIRTFMGIVLTSLSGIWIYIILFIL